MKTITQYIECYRKVDKNGNFYFFEKITDMEYNSETIEFKHTKILSNRCSKQIFEQRMQNSKFVEKDENHIIFEN